MPDPIRPAVIVGASSPEHAFATVAGAVLTAIGLIFLLVGLLIWAMGRRFRGPGERAAGKIVGFVTTDPGMIGPRGGSMRLGAWTGFGNQIVYRPTVEFTTAEGATVTATSSVGSNPRRGHVGDAVTVVYDPRNPQRIRVDSGGAATCLEIGFMLLGSGVAAIGIVILIASR